MSRGGWNTSLLQLIIWTFIDYSYSLLLYSKIGRVYWLSMCRPVSGWWGTVKHTRLGFFKPSYFSITHHMFFLISHFIFIWWKLNLLEERSSNDYHQHKQLKEPHQGLSMSYKVQHSETYHYREIIGFRAKMQHIQILILLDLVQERNPLKW